jgi:hypothetical protein
VPLSPVQQPHVLDGEGHDVVGVVDRAVLVDYLVPVVEDVLGGGLLVVRRYVNA